MEKYLKGIDNLAVFDSLIKSKSVIGRHNNIVVSISGGSDSDIVLDIVEKTKGNKKVEYVFFNTGIEYQATKDHLKYLENKYGVEIHEKPPIKPIPTCCREYGVPFISKQVSDKMERLQHNGFKWEDEPYDVLIKKYPKCISSIKWWCNKYTREGYPFSMFDIGRNKYLKEFIIQNPPSFRISNKCCTYSKKKPAKKFHDETNADLSVIGVRKAEGGQRAATYKNCFTAVEDGTDRYRPIFFMTDEDKRYYEKKFNIVHSDCYKKYGLKRTGCVGCPYSRNINGELEAIKMFEPKLYKACMKIFGASYEYTQKYREFCLMKKDEEKSDPDQLTMFDLFYDFSG